VTTPWPDPVDLDNCAREPIHVPGAIQPHGVLLGVDEGDRRVVVASANLADWYGVPAADALGRPLGDVVGADVAEAVLAAAGTPWEERLDEVPLPGGRVAALHRSGAVLVVEVEEPDDEVAVGHLVRESAMALQRAGNVSAVAAEAARRVRQLTGFDRVMVYRFDREWNGEVIAEAKADHLNTFLGLHYPSTDIPAQARELYRRNWLRVIPDIGYAAVPLVPAVDPATGEPLDLSTSTLRSVSPIHVEYLANMGVHASMSVSIVVGGQLWGLIACHHYDGPHRPGVAARNAAEYLGQLISLRIGEAVESDARDRSLDLVQLADRAAEPLDRADDVEAVLHEHEADVLKLAGATGALVLADGVRATLGLTPPIGLVEPICGAWDDDLDVLVDDHLAVRVPEAAEHVEVAAGVLALPLTTDRREVVLWFRSEQVRSVDWGGDPHNAKIAAEEGDGVRLSPRRSFDLWREVVRGRSTPWEAAEVRAAERFAHHLAAVLNRRGRDLAAAADDLQRAMLPATLPEVEGWAFDAHYAPEGVGKVGGDWYDAFRVDDRHVALVIGDVAGHGLPAASDMAQLRNGLRAYLLDDPDPASALERLDRLLDRLLPGSLATLVCGVLDVATSELHVSHAGHPPALHGASGVVGMVPLDGDPLLGLPPGRERHTTTLHLGQGDFVLMYSDGLVERSSEQIDVGIARLRSAVEDVVGEERIAEGTAARLAHLAVGSGAVDDVTLLLVQCTRGGPAQ
jgi:serine phosphatase RsbU (regulator of sigma subunit)/GAF domain-containing protein